MSFATLGVISFVLGLGVHLTVANHKLPILLPFAPITRIPLLQEIGPTRFALSIQLAAAVVLTVLLDRIRQRLGRHGVRGPAALLGLSLVVLIPLLPNGFLPSVRVRVPSYFAGSVADEIPDASIVLPYPFPYYTSNDPMLWQTASRMRFRIYGGEVYVPGPTRRSTNYPHGDLPPDVWAVLVERGPMAPPWQLRFRHWQVPSSAQRARLVAELRSYVPSHSIGALVVRRTGTQGRWVAALATSAFGAPTRVQDDVSVWLRPTPASSG
jgi:hypothetical protein